MSRVGAVVRPNTIGASTLAAMAVPADELERVAALVSGFSEVNHNYEREHRLNLWFVVTAPDAAHLQQVLDDIAARSGYEVLPFPLLEDYHIDLGFELKNMTRRTSKASRATFFMKDERRIPFHDKTNEQSE